jgi:hypothetical protein
LVEAKNRACSNITCGDSVKAPVVLLGDINSAVASSNALMIAGYVTTPVMLSIICGFLVLLVWLRYTNIDYNQVVSPGDTK